MTCPKPLSVPQALVNYSFLYADDTCIVFQHKNITEIEKQLLNDFLSSFDWFVNNKLSIHFSISAKTKQTHFYLVLNTNFEMLTP